MLVIGLTGGIGTGKTQVSQTLDGLGAKIINADLLGHEAYRPNTETWQKVIDAFGEDVLAPGGEVDRKALGAIVFTDPRALKRLNAIVHPRIRSMVKDLITDSSEHGRQVVVVEAALLVEASWTDLCDEVWMTISSEDKVTQRLRDRDGLNEEAVLSRVRSQMGQAERARHADALIENDGTLTELRDRVKELWDSRVVDNQDREMRSQR